MSENSRKCEHGRMPWECIDCSPPQPTPSEIFDRCIEVIRTEQIEFDPRGMTYFGMELAIEAIEQELKRYE